jgi:hypothetical protein
MNLRDVGSETSVNDTVQTNKMINKRLKCSTTTPIYIYSDKLINMEVVEYIYIYIYIYSIDSHQCINDDHFNSQVGIYNFYIDQFITIAIIATTLLHDRIIALIGAFVSIKLI